MVHYQLTRGRQLWLFLALVLLLAWAGSLRSPVEPPPVTKPEPRPAGLLSGATIERELAGGETHRYPVSLPANRYLRIEVDQRGIDVALRLLSPDRSALEEADGWTGTLGPDRLAIVTERAGVFVLEVVAASPSESPGRYAVRVVEQGEGTPRNRLRAEGEAALADGRLLYLSGEVEKYERAVVLFRQALESFQAAADPAGQADAQYALAMAQFSLGRNEEAREAFGRALPITRSLRDRRREAEVLVMRAVLHKQLGRPHDALDDASRALVLWRRVPGGATEVCRALNHLTAIYAELGDRSKTRAYAELSMLEARKLGDEYVLHEALRYYANSRLWTGDPGGALAPVREALALSERFGENDMPTEMILLNTLGTAQRMLGHHEAARESLEGGLRASRELGNRFWEASSLVQLAGTYTAPSERARRRELAGEALQVAREVGLGSAHASSLAMLARLELEAGDLREARRLVEESLRIHEERWRLAPTPSLQATYLDRNFAGHELYAEILVRSWQRGIEPRGAALALGAIERVRARSLQVQILRAREEVRGEVPRELVERRRTLAAELLAKTSAQRGSGSVGAVAELEVLAAQLRDVERRIGELSSRYGDLMLPEPVALEELRERLLDEQTVLLEYALGAQRSYVWAVGRSGLEVAELPPRKAIETAAKALLDAVTARSAPVRFEEAQERRTRIQAADAAAPALAAKLAAMVVDPIAPSIAGKRLAIVADGALQYVPWGALPFPGSAAAAPGVATSVRGRPLAAPNEIVHLPSAAALAAIRQGRDGLPSVRRTLAVVADPVLDAGDPRITPRERAPRRRQGAPALSLTALRSGPTSLGASWEALPYARAEARAILSIAPPGERLGAFGFAANRRFVREGGLNGYRIVHFATHAVVEGEQPERSGIVLSMRDREGRPQDGLLSLADLYQLRLGADLVVLSGCSTGLGQDLRGEGLVGLTRGFMFAGAPRVIVSLWDVEDRATAVLMRRFYELLLREGKAPAAALREAQLSMASSEEWREPYYWAGFVLQGDWR